MTKSLQAFGQVLWVKTKEPGRTGSKRGYCIIQMVNKQAEEQVWSNKQTITHFIPAAIHTLAKLSCQKYQVLSHIHLFGTNWVKVKHPRQQKRVIILLAFVFNSEFQNYLTCIDFPQVRTHPPTKVREDIDRDKERRIKKFYWCKTYADFKHQEFLIKRSNSK